ncbi:hypothetical protein BGZ68_007329 [Mortierella alpina]|nr:hypothetical protein BGZ68_007329 [Mortierella alpina]
MNFDTLDNAYLFFALQVIIARMQIASHCKRHWSWSQADQKKPASTASTDTTAKKLTPAQRAEAVAAAVAAAAEAAQASKRTAGSPKTAGIPPRPSVTKASSTAKDSSKNKANGEKEGKEVGAAADGSKGDDASSPQDDKDEDEEDKESEEKGQGAEANAAMRNMSVGSQQDVERNGVDSTKLEQAMSLMKDVKKKQKADREAGQREGEKVVLAKQDVELVMAELDLSKALAEKHLKEYGGDVVRTLEVLVAAA